MNILDIINRYNEDYENSPVGSEVHYMCDCGCGGEFWDSDEWDEMSAKARVAKYGYEELQKALGYSEDEMDVLREAITFVPDCPDPEWQWYIDNPNTYVTHMREYLSDVDHMNAEISKAVKQLY